MMTISSPRKPLNQQDQNLSSVTCPTVQQRTPFSIDDILSNSNRRRINFKSIPLPSNSQIPFSVHPQIFFNFSSSANQNLYQQWFDSFQKLSVASSLHHLWMSPCRMKYPYLIFHPVTTRNHLCNNLTPQSQNKIPPESHSQNVIRKRKLSHFSSSSQSCIDSPTANHSSNCINGDCRSLDSPVQSGCDLDNDRKKLKKSPESDSPLSALEKLTCSTFQNMEEKQNIMQAIVAGREAKVKRRKCRTAFTNFQLSVLEQRFNCHKYLTPTDRDQIANILGLSPPQVITWFQNRRAKQKRDLEEMKNDIKTVKKWTEKQNPSIENESITSSLNQNDYENEDYSDIDVESC